MNKIIILLVTLSMYGCAAPTIKQETADSLPPYTLCQEYKNSSKMYVMGSAASGYSQKSVTERLMVVYSAIQERDIDCKSELSIDALDQPKSRSKSKSKMVNCVPNEATGGVTCL